MDIFRSDTKMSHYATFYTFHVCAGGVACLHRTPHLIQLLRARQVSNVQARAARLSWAPPAGLVNRHSNGMPVSCSFEVSLSDKGRDGKYRLIYR